MRGHYFYSCDFQGRVIEYNNIDSHASVRIFHFDVVGMFEKSFVLVCSVTEAVRVSMYWMT